MKHRTLLIIILLLPISILAQEPEYHKVFFENSLIGESWYHSDVTYTSPSFVLNVENKLPVNNQEAFTPGNSLSLIFDSNPDGDWKVDLSFPKWRGKDHFKKADQLSFWIYLKSNTTKSDLPKLALNASNSLSEAIKLSDQVDNIKNGEWFQVQIPLSRFALDSSVTPKISGIQFSQASGKTRSHEILIDQVELLNSKSTFEIPEKVEISSAEAFERHVDIFWKGVDPETVRYIKIYRSQNGSDFKAIGVQNTQHFSKYTDFTGKPDQQYYYKISALGYDYSESELSEPVTANTRSMSDEELLEMVQEASFNYYWDGAEEQSGLALENIPGRKNMIASGASGFGVMALIVGAERGFISRDEFVTRITKILDFLERAESFHGAFSHFIDGPTGKAEPFFGTKDNGADLVETSFLMQGLLTVRQYLSEENKTEDDLRERITEIWEAVEWDWFKKDEDSKYLTWHWSPDQEWIIDHQLIGWNETMITYFLAIASPTNGVNAEMYYSGWASQEKKAQDYRSNWGEGPEGSMYTNKTTYFGIPLEVGVGVGGPLFFTHYSYLGLDPHKMEDRYVNYFDNNKDIVMINYRYSLENPGEYEGYGQDSWGLTASDGPEGYKAREAKPSQDDGTIAPTGAIASFPYTPEKSMAALKHFYRDYGSFLWGEYGFRDAFNLSENWTTPIYMGLNQAPMTVMIENYRSGLLWDLFMRNEEVQEALNEIKNIK